jgi:hypothetical protein
MYKEDGNVCSQQAWAVRRSSSVQGQVPLPVHSRQVGEGPHCHVMNLSLWACRGVECHDRGWRLSQAG